MREKTELKLMLWFTIIYLVLFAILAFIKGNYEFLYYISILSFLIFIISYYHKKMHLTTQVLLGLTILGIMHVLGGNIFISGMRLYDFWLIQNIFKYDNFVHAFGTFVVTFVVYSLIQPYLTKKSFQKKFLMFIFLILITVGLGAINEIVEFFAVMFLGAAKTVGDYTNNALDLVFNLIGSIIASFIIIRYHKKKHIGGKI